MCISKKKRVFILGAGASAHTGAPLTTDMWSKLNDKYGNGNHIPFGPVLEFAKQIELALHEKRASPFDDIEYLITQIDLALMKSSLSPIFAWLNGKYTTAKLKKVRATFIEYIKNIY